MVQKPNGKSEYFGVHRVVEEIEYIGIYRFSILITTKLVWEDAVELALLLNDAYDEGFNDSKDHISWDWQ